jgi:hypothetical protein
MSGSTKIFSQRTVELLGKGVWDTGVICTGGGAGAGGTWNIGTTGALDLAGDVGFSNCFGGSQPVINNAGVIRKTAGVGEASFGSPTLNNSGTIDVQIGSVYSQQFTQTAAGTLQLYLTSAGVTRLQVGAATLAGTLALTPSFGVTPTVGIRHQIMSGSRSGEFSTLRPLNFPTGRTVRAEYEPNGVTIVVQ